jgi:hypothetical protein
VGRGQDAAERGPPERPGSTAAVVDPVGQVGPSAGDEMEVEGRLDAGHVLLEPAGDGLGVDALDGLHGGADPTLYPGMQAARQPFFLMP